MRRATAFERDYRDLHGGPAYFDADVEIIRHEDVRGGAIVTRIDRPGVRLAFGAVGLFWALVIAAVLIVMLVVAGALIWGLFDPAQLTP